MSDDRFQKAEDQYFLLKGQLASGRITKQQFDAALKDLMVQDAQGRYWMLGADNGIWYVHDGKQWTEALPPGSKPTAPPPPEATPMSPPPPLYVQGTRGSTNMVPILAVGVIALVCLIGAIGVLFAGSQGLLRVSLTNPTQTLAAPLFFPTQASQVAASPTIATSSTAAVSTKIAAAPVVTSTTPAATVTATLSIVDQIAHADALTYQSQFTEAVAIYQQVVQTDPANALAYARWGRALAFQSALELRGELLTTAITKTESATLLAPNDPEVSVWLSRVYDWSGMTDKALTAAQKAVLLAPNSAQAYAVLAEALSDNNKPVDAEAAAQKALQLDANNADAHRMLGFLLYAKQQPPAAVAEIEKAAQAEPNLSLRFSDLGVFYRRTKDYAKAGDAFQKAIALYPLSASAYVGLGNSYLEQKQYDPALDAYTHATQINDKSPDAFYGLARAHDAAGDCTAAIPLYQKTVDLNPKASLALTYLGMCQLKGGNISAAADAAQKAAAINPNNVDTKNLVALVAAASATPTPNIPPGLFVTSLRLDPASPQQSQDVGFYATFLNTTGSTQNYRWLVYVYKADSLKNSFGETPAQLISIPVGTTEQKALGAWRAGVGTCGDYIARVAWVDENKQATPFKRTDGQVFELPFKVC
jgi:tetratricopeptide (TPR) repeat protein